jgi:DNA-binding transcriptional regulator GbsR (MarR family)
MKEQTLLIQFLGNNPTLRIIDFFLDNRTDYSKKEIIEALGMSKTTFYKVWRQLEKFKVVLPTRKYGKAQLFRLNEENAVVKKLMILDFTLIKQSIPKPVENEKVSVAKISKTV